MTRHLRFFLLSLCTFTLTFSAFASDASAQSKAFRISGEGVAPEGIPLPGQAPRPHNIVGQATHLGRHFGMGTVETVDADFSQFPQKITGTFGSGEPFVFVGANGDELVCTYGRDGDGNFTGEFELTVLDILPGGDLLVEAAWFADFVVVTEECTGKFAGVTGSWFMVAGSDPFILGSDEAASYFWEGKGRLNFPK